MKRILGDVGHHLERQLYDTGKGKVTEHERACRQREQREECRQRRIPCHLIGGSTAGHGVDQPARIERRQDVGHGRDEHGRRNQHETHRLALPVPESESENAAERSAAQVDTNTSHDA